MAPSGATIHSISLASGNINGSGSVSGSVNVNETKVQVVKEVEPLKVVYRDIHLYFGPFTYIYICSGFFPRLVAKLPKGLD
jgi:hypothetical protein